MSDEEVPFVRDTEPDPDAPHAQSAPADLQGEAPLPPAIPRPADVGEGEVDARPASELEPSRQPEPEPEPEPEPSFLGKSWPIFAAAVLVAATLFAVYSLLHPRSRPAAAVSAPGTPAFVTVETVEVRKEPSAKADAVATLSSGDEVEAIGTSGTWLEVDAKDGVRGYVPVDSVERAPEREARTRRQKTLLAFTPVYGVVGEATDVILAPYPLAPRAGRIAKGTVIAIHSVDHSYFGFKDKTWGIAFVSSAAVDLIPPDPRQPAIQPEKVKALKNLTIIDLEGEPPPEEPLEELGDAGEESQAAHAAPPAPASPGGGPAAPAAGIIEPAVVVRRVDPVYPDLARRAGIEGTVELEVSIDANGAVTDVEVLRGLPLGLSEAAAEAVHRWTYKPARTAAGPVASRKSVRVRFVLRGD